MPEFKVGDKVRRTLYSYRSKDYGERGIELELTQEELDTIKKVLGRTGL
jgi:hypothetical protein